MYLVYKKRKAGNVIEIMIETGHISFCIFKLYFTRFNMNIMEMEISHHPRILSAIFKGVLINIKIAAKIDCDMPIYIIPRIIVT
jgi:uncharacterized protein with PQ loop repeat